MTRVKPAWTVGSAVVMASVLTVAGEIRQAGVTLTPEQMDWEPNPRVPGLGVARIIGSGKDPGS